jgi:hypothetical protein
MGSFARIERNRVVLGILGMSIVMPGCGIVREALLRSDTETSSTDSFSPAAPSSSDSDRPYSTQGKEICAEDYKPIEAPRGAGVVKLQSIKDLPLGSLRYVSSEFYLEGGYGKSRSQLHVVHREGEKDSSVACMSYRGDSPSLDWSVAYPRSVTRGSGNPRAIDWQPLRAGVNSKAAGKNMAWHYSYQGDPAQAPWSEKRVGASEWSGYATWYQVAPGQFELHSSIHDGASGALRVRYSLDPAPNGFARLKKGTYRFIAGFSSYAAEVNGEKLVLDFVDRAGQGDIQVTKNIGLDAGFSFWSNMEMISGIEKTGHHSAHVTLREFYLNCKGNGGWNVHTKDVKTVKRTNMSSFADLGFYDDVSVEAVAGYPNQVALRRAGENHRVTVILERVAAEVEPALID